MKHFLRWFLIAALMAFGMVVLALTGMFARIYSADVTKLSFVILAVFWACSIQVGALHWQLARIVDPGADLEAQTAPAWFVSDLLLTIGMLGTVLGFIYMLSTSFSGISVKDAASLQGALKCMGVGMSTALYTTAAGMIGSCLLKIQLFLFERAAREVL